ncbi:MAG: secretory lipase family protein [Aeromicrobium sp.]|nr:secretory lipase family protein [Aeromicrobium sp.]
MPRVRAVSHRKPLIRFALGVALVSALVTSLPAQAAVPTPTTDPFYRYTAGKTLASIKPGTVLKTRTISYHIVGLALPLKATQLLYRSTDQLGKPSVNVTSVVSAPGHTTSARAISYQSFYDSLNPADEPSYAISGGLTLGGMIPNVELGLFGPFLLQGYSIIIPDTEGQTADFAAGPEYGTLTLDAIRAASSSKSAGLSKSTKVGMIGYSGGAIATGWASALAPTYAPDVNRQLVGAAEGGVLVNPAHNLHYIDGSLVWSGVTVMAVIGISRAFHIDLTPYLNAYGLSLYNKLHAASIETVLGAYPGLTWAKLAKPAYQTPESIPVYVRAVNKLNLGSVGTPTAPMFIGQGAGGVLEGTPGNKPGIGKGDGVMIAGDVRSLARQYCSHGATIKYAQYDLTSHVTSVPQWLPSAISWLNQRFAGAAAPQNCSSIAAGNSLAPLPTP